ncbi:hypothetical protein LYNGBM3L_64320 [Moorena producens 3L]|uniref:Uncharacterized protein n=1 Tax=Moorena producens 3L TaxID=489825 RepID=F4Y1L3_9CYAN|nr:hypothetical protein LYNGBM3L_64320 [Moorena producens 3L]OLT64132.1 hypothetical protein BI334_03025 [Moorena producens 3L]
MGNGEWGMGNGEWGMGNRNPPLTPTRRGRAGDGSVIGGNSGRFSDRHIWRNFNKSASTYSPKCKKPTQVR